MFHTPHQWSNSYGRGYYPTSRGDKILKGYGWSASLASQIVLMKRKFDNATWEVQNSRKRLAMADTYKCLEPHALYGVQAGEDITNKDIQYGIHQIMDPWE
jgi:hypothetical protein